MKSIISLLLLIVIIAAARAASPQYNEVPGVDWTYFSMVYTSAPNTILLINSNKQLIISRNSGKTWNPVKAGDGNIILGAGNIISDGQSNNNTLVINSVPVGQIYNTTFSVSYDGGLTFKQSVLSYQIGGISVNPNNPMQLLGNSGEKIMVSNDFGLTWNDVSNGKKLFLIPGTIVHVKPEWDPQNPNSFFSILDSGNEKKTGVLSVSTDLGKTQKSLISGAMDMTYTKNYFYVAVLDSLLGTQLWVRSNDAPSKYGNADGFLLCEFPFGSEIQINDYRILDDTAGAIYLGMQISLDGESPSSVSGHVFVSNSLGNIFTLALKHVAVSKQSLYDFNPIKGAPGAYLFNGVSNPRPAPGAAITVRSFITYDNGGRWSRLAKPSDMDCNIVKGCHLNVHGLSAYLDKNRGYGPFYTIENAPGLVLATGTANPALSSSAKPEWIKTVLSNDNGQTWKKIAEFGSIYEFGAFGSSIIYASAMEDTKYIYYTFDQGLNTYNFTMNKAYDVQNIITNPSNSDNKFLLLAYDSNDSPKLIFVDLTPVQPRDCTDNDLNVKTLNCVLGRRNSYKVVKPNVECTLTEVPVNSESAICECTIDDYECDIGYAPSSSIEDSDSASSSSTTYNTNLTCQVDRNSKYVPINADNCVPGQNYTVQNGFRKVAGSECVGGVSNIYEPKTAICKEVSKAKSKGWIAAVIIVLLVVGLGGFGFFVYKNPDFKQKLKKMIGASKETKYSVVGIKPNSLADDEFGIEDDDAQILNDNDLQEDNF